jgi:hypothetical protein
MWWRIVWAWRGLPVEQRFLAVCAYCGRVRVSGGLHAGVSHDTLPSAAGRHALAEFGDPVGNHDQLVALCLFDGNDDARSIAGDVEVRLAEAREAAADGCERGVARQHSGQGPRREPRGDDGIPADVVEVPDANLASPLLDLGAGAVTVNFGTNQELGGANTTSAGGWYIVLPKATVEADGKILVRDGALAM